MSVMRSITDSNADSNEDARLEIEIGGQHDHVANCHAAWPRQHERHHVGHFAGVQQTSRLPGFFSFSGGQSASSVLMTGPGETEPTRMPCLNTWRRTVWTNQLIAHLDDAYTGSHGVGKWAAKELVTMMSPEGSGRAYRPPKCIGAIKKVIQGDPHPDFIQ